jgi:hypothetical protein
MTALTWDDTLSRRFEQGVDKGVLYIRNKTSGLYDAGFAWNGLTTVTEAPTGAAPTALWADNIKYLNLLSAEVFAGTIAAYTYPDEFGQCDGTVSPESGVSIGQQTRSMFGICYRTRIGDAGDPERGFKLHMVYGLLAEPSQKAYATVNDQPAAIDFSWNVSSTPEPVTNLKPTSIITIDSTKVSGTALATLEDMLYGTAGADPVLPLPDDLLAIFSGSVTTVTPTIPTFSANTITIPTVTGVTYYINGEPVTGAVVITEDTVVTAEPDSGYDFPPAFDNDWEYIHT